MAYVEQHNFLSYFMPLQALGTGLTISGAAANYGEYVCVKPCMVHRGLALVTTAIVANTTPPVLTLSKRITPGSDAGKTKIMDITIPGGTGIGKVPYKDVDPVQFMPGDTLVFSHVPGTGSPAGVVWPAALCENSPKTPMENADMVESV